MTKGKPPMIGALIAVLGVLTLIILMLVIGVFQIAGVVHVDFAWWAVMVLLAPTIVVTGAYVSSLQSRIVRKRERAERSARIIAEREQRIAERARYRSGRF